MKPILQALLLADRIYEDKTGKKIIAGTFNRLMYRKETKATEKDGGEKRPVTIGGPQAGSPYAYVSLTEIRNEANCQLRYVNLGSDELLFLTDFKVKCDSPLKTVEIVVWLPPLPLQSGSFAVELLCGDEPLGRCRIIVEEIPEDSPK